MSDSMRKLMESVEQFSTLGESMSHDQIDLINELEMIADRMSGDINDFDNVLRQLVGNHVIYDRFQAYPGGHIRSSLGDGNEYDTSLLDIIQDVEEHFAEEDGYQAESLEEDNGTDVNSIADAVETVWGQIAYDIMEEEVSAIDVVELATDADRLANAGYLGAQNAFRELVSNSDYRQALEAVASALPFEYYEAGGSMAQ